MLALLPFGAAVGEDAVSSPEEVLSYWLPETSATPILRRAGARRSGGWPETPRSIGRYDRDLAADRLDSGVADREAGMPSCTTKAYS